MELICYTGGELETNAYFLRSPKGVLCFDAPEGVAEELERRQLKVEGLILTHGHFDHIMDAAAVAEAHQCPVFIHSLDRFMIEDPKVFEMFGIGGIPAVSNSQILDVPEEGSAAWSFGGRDWMLYHIPGHSPGSIAFYDEKEGIVIGGDILFKGGVGRWDLPGGSQTKLFKGIHRHLMTLPDSVKVFPGHGGATTIGLERKMNGYLQK